MPEAARVAERPRLRPRRAQKDRSAETRVALIEGALGALAEVGYARTTTAEITRRAGVTTGALQHHFGSKEDLILAVLDYQFAEVVARLEAFASQLSVKQPKTSQIHQDWRGFIKVLSQIFGEARYLAIWEVMLGTRADSHLHAAVLQHRVKSLAVLEELWIRVFGRLSSNRRRVADLMHFTLAMMRGFVFYSAIEPDPAFFQRQLTLLESFIASALNA
ncbi:MAG: TetR/AcrR family transcriptional regulator [Proteobacteria bacterium]|nr:TetR/AcrR family transcriptional regulator [Pseudomonadota bacterium]